MTDDNYTPPSPEQDPSAWIEQDPKTGQLISAVPEGKRGQHLGMVPLRLSTSKRGENVIAIPKMDRDETLVKTPHGGKPMEVIELNGIDYDDFKEVLAGAYLAYIGGVYGKQPTGAPPTLQEISAYVSGMSEPKVKMIMAHPAFKKACEARGIAVGKRPGITAKQDLALSVILDPTAGISLRQRLKKAGVPMAKYRAWLRNPQFGAYVDQLGGGILKEFENDMMVALTGLAVEGDRESIKLAFEISGKHNPRTQETMNVREVMVQIMHAIQRHVTDPVVLQRLGSEIMMIAGASGASDATTVNASPDKPAIEGAE